MNRNPNNRSPRQLRDCTFQDWADPIERPAPKTGILWVLASWVFAIIAMLMFVWGIAQ